MRLLGYIFAAMLISFLVLAVLVIHYYLWIIAFVLGVAAVRTALRRST